MEQAALIVLLEATLRMSTALMWPALGELLIERTGLFNLGMEGSILWGALGGLAGALAADNPWGGAAAGMVLGALCGLAFGLLTVNLQLNAVLTGTAINLMAFGGTAFVYRWQFGETGTGATVPLLPPLWNLEGEAGLLRPLAAQTLLFPLALMAAAALAYFLNQTREGMRWRACGEDPEAARLQGIRVSAVRLAACTLGGAMAGLGGAFLVVASTGVFVERMSAGRGFMALAIVAFGRWKGFGIVQASLLFGAASAAQFFFQALGTGIAYQWMLMLPYVLTLVALALRSKTSGIPAVLQ